MHINGQDLHMRRTVRLFNAWRNVYEVAGWSSIHYHADLNNPTDKELELWQLRLPRYLYRGLEGVGCVRDWS